MKKLTSIIIAAATFACAAFAQPGSDSLKLRLDTPVMVSGTVLAAGDYMIRTSESSGNVVLSIASETANTHILALANRIGGSSDISDFNRVVLVREAGGYRLDKLWIGYDGYEILGPAR